jgi:excisionase family DNA binding protein
MAIEKLYTVREAADALRLSPWTMYGKLSRGEVVGTRVGGRRVIRQSELEKLLIDDNQAEAVVAR